MASPTCLWRVSDSRPTCNALLFAGWQSSCLNIIVTILLHWLALCLAIERTQVDGGYSILSTHLHYKAPACLDTREAFQQAALYAQRTGMKPRSQNFCYPKARNRIMLPSLTHRRAHLLSQDANPLCFVSVVFGGEQ